MYTYTCIHTYICIYISIYIYVYIDGSVPIGLSPVSVLEVPIYDRSKASVAWISLSTQFIMENISPSVIKTLNGFCDDNNENEYKNYGNTLYSTNNKENSELNYSAYDASENLPIIVPPTITSKKPELIKGIIICIYIYIYIYIHKGISSDQNRLELGLKQYLINIHIHIYHQFSYICIINSHIYVCMYVCIYV
jgi:hypothetical protein